MATNADLDRETTNSYTLTLTATDQGTIQMSSSIELTVILADVNDNNPMFAVDPYSVRVAEVGRNEWCPGNQQKNKKSNFTKK